jgi:Golgi SNAP receptor complex protein 2
LPTLHWRTEQLTEALQHAATQRADLITGTSTSASASDTRRRFQTTPAEHSTLHPDLRPQGDQHSESPFRGPTPQPGFGTREQQALDEHSFIQNTGARLDDFLAQGREVLDNLRDQRTMLKGTHRRLLDAANTLGLSRDVIGWIERRRCAVSLVHFGPHTHVVSAHKICTSSWAALFSLSSVSI